MTYVWAIIVSTIVVLIVYGMVSSKLRERRAKRHSLSLLPEITDHIKPDTQYRVVLTSGTIFADVRFFHSHCNTGWCFRRQMASGCSSGRRQ